MKVIIQCCSGKEEKYITFNGKPIKLVSDPDKKCDKSDSFEYYRPDSEIVNNQITWRDIVELCNKKDQQPYGLLKAVFLYKPRNNPHIYRDIANFPDLCGLKNFFILSAGWGLVRGDYFLPSYDITFNKEALPCSQRDYKKDRGKFHDFNHLKECKINEHENIYFFGAKDYLPFYYDLTKDISGRKVIYYKSEKTKKEKGYVYIKYDKKINTNWHYSCVKDFIAGQIEK